MEEWKANQVEANNYFHITDSEGEHVGVPNENGSQIFNGPKWKQTCCASPLIADNDFSWIHDIQFARNLGQETHDTGSPTALDRNIFINTVEYWLHIEKGASRLQLCHKFNTKKTLKLTICTEDKLNLRIFPFFWTFPEGSQVRSGSTGKIKY